MWSTVIVGGSALFLELLPQHGLPLYVADPTGRHSFLGTRWSKGLRFSAHRWQRTIAEHDIRCTSTFGRVFHFSEADVTWRRGPREPDILWRNRAEIAALADTLGVPSAHLGVCGSALYKNVSEQGDFDFVVFEDTEESPARAAAHRLAGACQVDGVPYHLRFRVDGVSRWCDPHFAAACPLTEAIIVGHARPAGAGLLDGQAVASAAHGHHMPAHYVLDSGHHLVSFRFGHSDLFRAGDRLTTAYALPVVVWNDVASFVVTDGDQQVEVLR